MSTPKILVAVRLEKFMINEVVKLQESYDMTTSQIIRSALTMFLKSKHNKARDNNWFTG